MNNQELTAAWHEWSRARVAASRAANAMVLIPIDDPVHALLEADLDAANKRAKEASAKIDAHEKAAIEETNRKLKAIYGR